MDSLSSKCVEEANSTDCLLRTLLQFLEDTQKAEDGKFEWDPITFGFTVPIAIFAAGFSLIAITQATLAAGPGRRKTNYEAIGRWSDRTRWQWQWWNLGYLHIATTPILTVKNVTKKFPQSTTVGTNQGETSPGASAASWLVFLDKFGLSHLELEGDATKTVLADYLPGDLLAAPALVEVGLVFMFMAASDAPLRVLGADTRNPSFIGSKSQFEIRQHPTLGAVGAFSSPISSEPWSEKISPKYLDVALDNTKGFLHLSNKIFLTLNDTKINITGRSVKYPRNESSMHIMGIITLGNRITPKDCIIGKTIPNINEMSFDDRVDLRCPCQDIVDVCSQLSQGFDTYKDWIKTWSAESLHGLRKHILSTLTALDEQLLSSGLEDVECQAVRLFADTICLHEILGYFRQIQQRGTIDSLQWLQKFAQELAKKEEPRDWSPLGLTHDTASGIIVDLVRRFMGTGGTYQINEIAMKKAMARVQERIDGFFSGTASGSSSHQGSNLEEQKIVSILAWRTLLVAVLYFTAPDITPLQSSGLWGQVIPML
ncbi:hypothetical protein FAUST_12052 [Fusarium austroamericanum]|uniref:Uncharacterized protein n=1 Tax=Fusarium austroamericanum TaxID=282268 RepID=A0AAN5YXD0_FUSAU|nr:hypothetical protein FAUST_12052 [Fusarium austroamericanum]